MNGTKMAQQKHLAIKLFGRKIPVPDTQMPASSLSKDNDSSDQEKVLKKPDKIVPCSRCNSSETKFCYFNNYSVNQPRHFCRNCQRYWTAGGTMRNVPVGAGRRKNKHLPSQFCQISAWSSSDGIPVARVESSVGPCDNVEEPSSSGSSITACSNRGNEPPEDAIAAFKCSTGQAPICPDQAQWSPAPALAVQGLCPSNIPLSFIPASYRCYMPVWAAGMGKMSLVRSNGSPTLGKHCRDSNLSDEEKPEKCLFAPKTKRIDQSIEASKSPLWDALGHKPDGQDAVPY